MAQTETNREHLLLVETEAGARMRSMRMLREYGYEVASASTAAEALVYLELHPGCKIVVSDVLLPAGASGFALLDQVSRLHSDVGVVLMLTSGTPQLAVQAFRRGAADVVLKPLCGVALQNAVAGALLQGEMRRETVRYVRNLESLVSERTGKLREIMADLELSYDVTIEAMGDALDMRDEETEGHSKRVMAYTVALAKQMRLVPHDLKTIARGAFLHDIGKIAIPDSILLKPGKLTEEEMIVMQGHCEQGYRIVRKIPFLEEAAEIVYAHQERFDGSGYPRALSGRQIPLGARIFAVADTLDAMTSDRPYRRGLSFGDAIAEIERCSGTQFDPIVVDEFLAMPGSTWPAIRAEVGRQTHAAELVRAASAA